MDLRPKVIGIDHPAKGIMCTTGSVEEKDQVDRSAVAKDQEDRSAAVKD